MSERQDAYALLDKFPDSKQEINIADALIELLHPPAVIPEVKKIEQKIQNNDDDYQKNVVLPEEVFHILFIYLGKLPFGKLTLEAQEENVSLESYRWHQGTPSSSMIFGKIYVRYNVPDRDIIKLFLN